MSAEADTANDNMDYRDPAGNEFPIMAYYPTVRPGDDTEIPVTDCELKVLGECGFNIVYGNPRIWSFPLHTGVSGISFGLELDGRKSAGDFYKDLQDQNVIEHPVDGILHPRNTNISLIGFNDQPSIADLGKISLNYRQVQELNLPLTPYVNVSVNGDASLDSIGDAAERLETYLSELRNLLSPVMWSYDYYPVYCNFRLSGNYSSYEDEGAQRDLADSSTLVAGSEVYVNRLTFLWLEIFMRRARETGIPFWYLGLSREFQSLVGDGTKPTYILRRCTGETYMRFAAFSALAYGAKGLSYWAYTANMNVDRQRTYFFNAPYCLDMRYPNNARPTELWGQLRKVNKEVQFFSHIFLGSRDHEVYHTGSYCYNNSSNKVWEGTTPFPGSKGPVLGLISEAMGALVSFFKTGQAAYYVMFVNHDIHNPQEIKIAWAPGYWTSKVGEAPAAKSKVARLGSSPDPVDPIGPITPDDPVLYKPYTLQPGGYLIFSYSKKL